MVTASRNPLVSLRGDDIQEDSYMRVVSVVGARPQFVKLAPVDHAMNHAPDVEHVIIHTGQHYDRALSDVFFAELGIRAPDIHLGVGSGSHGAQTGAMLAKLDEQLHRLSPDWTLVYGDTNSTVAAALAAVKLQLPIAHLEAGLRSFNRKMPEEHNRVLTDHAADLLLAPTKVAVDHLAQEGLRERTLLVGDVMTDVCLRTRDKVSDDEPSLPPGVDPGAPWALATIHRAENTDFPARLTAIVHAIADVGMPVVLLAHPRLRAKCQEFGIPLESHPDLHVTSPLGYLQMVRLVMAAHCVLTDSGGLQKEAFLLGTPCTTLRTETEWVETLEGGWNVLHPDTTGLAEAVARPHPSSPRGTPYGDGHAAQRVVNALSERRGS